MISTECLSKSSLLFVHFARRPRHVEISGKAYSGGKAHRRAILRLLEGAGIMTDPEHPPSGEI
jgi:hypothetical protein